jgi:hypothetical protein
VVSIILGAVGFEYGAVKQGVDRVSDALDAAGRSSGALVSQNCRAKWSQTRSPMLRSMM